MFFIGTLGQWCGDRVRKNRIFPHSRIREIKKLYYTKSNMDKKKFGFVAFMAILLVGIIIIMTVNRPEKAEVIVYTEGDPMDIALDMANAWRNTLIATEDPITALSEFVSSDQFTRAAAEDLKSRIADSSREPLLDVILCQVEIPPRVVGRMIVQTDTDAQVMLMARGLENRSPNQTIVKMRGNGENAWVIDSVTCSQGEAMPEFEFAFDHTGYLLKSVPPPYTAGDWHVVFEQDGLMGYVAPLTFGDDSLCISTAGEESVCAPDTFKEPLPALVQGDMTEEGVIVKRITFN
jgi:hypothetical protein